MARTTLPTGDVDALLRVMWAPHQPQQDIDRWLQQGFVFQPTTAAFPLGLVQGHGGPCGVLAAVQAELVRLYLFPERHEMTVDARKALLVKPVDEQTQEELLVRAMASILFQCGQKTSTRSIHVIVKDPAASSSGLRGAYDVVRVENIASPSDNALLRVLRDQLPAFKSPWGVVLFMFSVLHTKGVDAVRDEMDDLDTTLTAQFGHCGQELLNLLLTGVASSNVFDGSVPMGDTGLMLRGIAQRPRLGYLTQLEALRYCQVGNYYKSPQFPVWIIGSASHFSVVFGVDMRLCEASASLMLFQRMQRVFKAFDPMEAGFLEIGNLRDALQQLGVSSEILTNDFWMAKLCTRLEVSGAGIVLWDEFWKVVSVLLHTGDVELALSGTYGSGTSGSASRPKSDEEMARELQAQFDAEDSGNGVAPQPPAQLGVAASSQDTSTRFELYYYNGLSRRKQGEQSGAEASSPELVKVVVAQADGSREFIGQSIPIELSTSTSSGGNNGHPLEEILKTKWMNSSFNWQGNPVPSVD